MNLQRSNTLYGMASTIMEAFPLESAGEATC